MNGIHDMGGMQGMGPIEYEKNEPVFHAGWEARVYAMNRAVGATGKLKGSLRPPIESLTALEYLRTSYYEKWFTSLIERMVAGGLVTRAEIESGQAAEGSAKSVPAVSAADVPAFMRRVPPGATIRSLRASKSVSMYTRATSIRSPTHACRAMSGAKSARSNTIAALRLFPTPTSMAWATSRSTSTRCVSRRANYGAIRPRRRTRSISNCGTIILSRPDSRPCRPNASRRCRGFRARRMGQYSPNLGRRRHLPSPSSFPNRGISPGRNGPARLGMKLKPPLIAASQMTARTTITIGWRHSNGWSSPRV